jgi:predicted ATPase/class 3 adenylate cyclase
LVEFPSGTVTFLFTDIEGSTRLWEQHPEAMQPTLALHNSLIRESIEEQGGVVVKNTGDGFYAAFFTADQGLQAALEAQRRLLRTSWDPAIKEIRVRMALHTGSAEPRGEDYYGRVVNRAARLCAAAHGYQVLLSAATMSLVVDDLQAGDPPAGLDLLDLGEHRLKGLLDREHIYQLQGPGLPSFFPPPASLESDHDNLPAQATPFLGRERQRAELVMLLSRDGVRLVTLSGPGGTGKTRLSLAVAEAVEADFGDGVRFVELAPVTDPALVLSTIAEDLGIKSGPGIPAGVALIRFLRRRQMLLVLDNFEQIVEAGPQVAELLAGAPRLKILVTSREILRISGEHDYPVPPLALPVQNKPLTAAVLAQNEAVALFRQRAGAAQPGFMLSEENAETVVAICRRLDGLPLAIELAAARIRMMPAEALLDRLEGRLQILTGGPRDAPVRQRTIRDAIDWSYNLLSEGEKTLLAQLSVFVDGWTLAAAEAVCSVGESFEVLDGLASLRDKSLIQQKIGASGDTRFSMLEIIREYARERLQATDQGEVIVERHIRYYAGVVDEDPQERIRLYGVEGYATTFLEEYGNMRAAMKHALADGAYSPVLEIASGQGFLQEYLSVDARVEVVSWTEKALAEPERIDPALRIKALDKLGQQLLIVPGGLPRARAVGEEALTIRRALGVDEDLLRPLNHMGIVATRQGDLEEARVYFEDALDLAKAIGKLKAVAIITGNISSTLADAGEDEQAEAYAKEAIELCSSEALFGERAVYQLTMAGLELRRGHFDRAMELALEALDQLRKRGRSHYVTWALTGAGLIATRQARLDDAGDYLEESLIILKEYHDEKSVIAALEGAAELLVARHKWQAAGELLGAATALREEATLSRMPVAQVEYDDLIAILREHLEPLALEDALGEGGRFSWDEALEEALAMLAAS